ncbi:MAG: UvrD-helicase domain-containing protein [Alphaproteobacteria bacterium]|nr:UvrD-helicase domain-containing protein [Alphaproteobacteria bacterium]
MSDPDHLQGLNAPQREAVEALDGPLLILAGAGSGKTRVLTRRVAHLLHTGRAQPWQVLAVTFTNKAAQEMKHRIGILVGPEAAADLWVSTFHSTCVRMLRRDIAHLGYPRSFVIYDDDDQNRLLKDILKGRGVDKEKLSPRRLRGLIDRAKTAMAGPEALADEPDLPGVAVSCFEDYEARLRAANALDFNDLINKTAELLRDHDAVRHRWQRRFRYIMVDEYQDTNRAQYRLVNLLAAGHGNLAVVGDDDQSIYSFRGADIRNILDFERDHPDARVVRLEQNYRSTERILQAAMAVVENNRQRKDKRLWTAGDTGEPIFTLIGRDEETEGREVAGEIRTLLDQGQRPEDIAIIYRTNARSRVFELALSEARLPYVIVGARRFYERLEIKDLLGYLRLVVNPADEMGFKRVVNVPRRGIGARTVDAIEAHANQHGVSMLEAARAMGEAKGRTGRALSGFVALIDRFRAEVPSHSPGELVQLIAEETGYLPALKAEKTTEAEDRIRNIQELGRDVESEAEADIEDPFERLQAFLDRASLTGQDSELPDGGRITLMTAHLAKGLEYPVVFATGLVEGSFPMVHGGHYTDRELEEERRLMYVAITRAQERLYLTRALRRMIYGRGIAPTSPSPFLDEIPRDLMRPAGSGARRRPAPAVGPTHQKAKLDAFLAWQKQRAPVDAAPPDLDEPVTTRPATDPSDFAVGVRVVHRNFGLGVIRGKKSFPGTIRLDIEFAKRRRRTINPRLEPLEIVID